MIGKTWNLRTVTIYQREGFQYYRAPLVATDELEEECEGGLEDADHEEGVQHPTGYEPLE